MWIDPFWAGVVFTLLLETAALVIASAILNAKSKKKR